MVLEDEKYFTFDGSNMEGNDNYYTNDNANCPDSVRFVGKEKFPPKILNWTCLGDVWWINIFGHDIFIHPRHCLFRIMATS